MRIKRVRIKARAGRQGRSLQVKMREAGAVSARWQKRLADRAFSDSVHLIREDRNR